jgi:hypothetical protein
VLVAAIGALAACSGGVSTDGDEADVTAAPELFLNDRVGQMLEDHPEKAPKSFAEYEDLFQVGRKCARTDSKEIFVVDETGTRDDTGSGKTDKPLPRAVITGCQKDPSNPDSLRDSYSLMTALISTNDSHATNPADGDTMVLTPLEVMALDDTTGLYNFYKFFSTDKGVTILRVERTADGQVNDIILAPGAKKPVRQPSKKDDGTKTQRCYGCHVNGGPLMNEIHDPWTNWVSFRKSDLPLDKMSGETLSIVSEAVPSPTTHRSSLAKGLEDALTAGMREYVIGKGAGYGQAVLQSKQPGTVLRLLRSAFCETDLNYTSAFDTVPVEVFFDPAAIAAASPQPPVVNQGEPFPTLMPVRSEMDKRIELFLVKGGFLSQNTRQAIRLLDDEKDIFSDTRCSVADTLPKVLPPNAQDVDAAVRKAIGDASNKAVPAGPRRTLVQELIDPKANADDLTKAQNDYATDVARRYAKKTELLSTTSGQSSLESAVLARKQAAVRLFPTSATPLPEDVINEGALVAKSAEEAQVGTRGRDTEFDPPEIRK